MALFSLVESHLLREFFAHPPAMECGLSAVSIIIAPTARQVNNIQENSTPSQHEQGCIGDHKIGIYNLNCPSTLQCTLAGLCAQHGDLHQSD